MSLCPFVAVCTEYHIIGACQSRADKVRRCLTQLGNVRTSDVLNRSELVSVGYQDVSQGFSPSVQGNTGRPADSMYVIEPFLTYQDYS